VLISHQGKDGGTTSSSYVIRSSVRRSSTKFQAEEERSFKKFIRSKVGKNQINCQSGWQWIKDTAKTVPFSPSFHSKPTFLTALAVTGVWESTGKGKLDQVFGPTLPICSYNLRR